MIIMNNVILSTVNNLLADVSNICGVPLLVEASAIEMDWLLHKAPLLEKELLREIENDEPLSDEWPDWIRPLVKKWLTLRDPNHLRELRTILLFCYKARLQHSYESEVKSVNTFVESNDSCQQWNRYFNSNGSTRVLNIARSLVRNVLVNCEWGNPPLHGPGAVFDKHVPKGAWSTWYTKIEEVYPYYEYFYPSKGVDYVDYLPEKIEDNIPARITLVPKDSRGPRLICIHPAEAIWAQQSARCSLESAIQLPRNKRSQRWCHLPHPCGKIHFRDQTVNQSLAIMASIDRRLATIDLKEASDRIPNSLVEFLFDDDYRYIGCSRAQKIFYRGKSPLIENYAGYAPMGNATTFPVESLTFWALCTASIIAASAEDNQSATVSLKDAEHCYVFGDDIIVPSHCLDVVKDVLTGCNLIVNSSKSFSKGSFRESCGMDAYKGVCVTPLRWRLGSDIYSYSDMVAACNLASRLGSSGHLLTARHIYDIIKIRLKGIRNPLFRELRLTNNPDHGGIAECVSDATLWESGAVKLHPTLHKFVTRITSLRDSRRRIAGDWYHLIASLTSLERGGASTGPVSEPVRLTGLSRTWSDVI